MNGKTRTSYFLKNMSLGVGLVLGLAIIGAVVYRLFNPAIVVEDVIKWTLHDPGARYVIHGSSNFGTGGPYYLYWYKDGKSHSAYILPNSPVDLTHYTDHDVEVNGDLKIEAGKLSEVYLSEVKYKR